MAPSPTFAWIPPANGFNAARAYVLGDVIAYPISGLKDGHIRQLLGRVQGVPEDRVLLPEKPERFRQAGLHSADAQVFLAALAAARAARDTSEERTLGAETCDLIRRLADPDEDGPTPVGALRHPRTSLRHAVETWRETFPYHDADYPPGDPSPEEATPIVFGLALACAGVPSDHPGCTTLAGALGLRAHAMAAAYAAHRLAELIVAGDPGKRLNGQNVAGQLIADLRRFEEALHTRLKPIYRQRGEALPDRPLATFLEPLPSLLREGSTTLAESTLSRPALPGEGDAPTRLCSNHAPVVVPYIAYLALSADPPATVWEEVANRGGDLTRVLPAVMCLLALRHGDSWVPEESWGRVRGRKWVSALWEAADPAEWSRWEVAESAAEERQRVRLRENLARQLQSEKSQDRKTIARQTKESSQNQNPFSHPRSPKSHVQGSTPFAPPPEVWLGGGEETLTPEEKRRLKEARARRRIDWKEERHRSGRRREEPKDE